MMEALSNLPELERRVIEQSAVGVTYGMCAFLCVCVWVCVYSPQLSNKQSQLSGMLTLQLCNGLCCDPIQRESMALTCLTPRKLK